MEPVSIAFLYASDPSKTEFELLAQFLAPLQNRGLILMEGFDITKDSVGRQEMSEVAIVACIINPAFLFFFFEEESHNGNLEFLLRERRVVPIIQSPSLFKTTPFADLASLPSNKKAISIWSSKDEAYMDIALSIKKLAENIQFQQTQDQAYELDQNLQLIMPSEDEFYRELDDLGDEFPTSYQRFKNSPIFWNFFVGSYGYRSSVMSQAELEERLLQREQLIMREISAEKSMAEIKDFIKTLYETDISVGFRICLVIYDLETPAQLNYDIYRQSFHEKYQKFMQILHDTQNYQFDGKLRIAFKMFNKKEICSF